MNLWFMAYFPTMTVRLPPLRLPEAKPSKLKLAHDAG